MLLEGKTIGTKMTCKTPVPYGSTNLPFEREIWFGDAWWRISPITVES
jgi:hypothetical protein